MTSKRGASYYLGFVIIIIICISLYGLRAIYGFSLYPDEFGYWASAASLCGYDWTEITSIGSYYSYGYSILLAVIFSLFTNSLAAYRAAIILNVVLQCLSVILIYRMLAYTSLSEVTRLIISSAAVLYPVWTFYSQTTMAESLLMFMFTLVTYLTMRFMQRPSFLTGGLLAISAVYMYLVHMRMIGTLCAVVLTLTIWAARQADRRSRIAIALTITLIIILFAISFLIKENVISEVYTRTSDSLVSVNDYSGQLSRIQTLFSIEGIVLFLRNIPGKLLYISLATYGLGLWGLAGAVAAIIRAENIEHRLLHIYFTLAVLMQISIALIYTMWGSDPHNNRLDIYLHGRYIDMILPLLTVYGICYMLHKSRTLKWQIALTGLNVATTIYTLHIISVNETHMSHLQGTTMAGVSYMLRPLEHDAAGFTLRAAVFGTIAAWGIWIVIDLWKRWGYNIILVPITVLQIILSLHTCDKYIYILQTYVSMDAMTATEIAKMLRDDPGRPLIHIYEGGRQYIEIMQFYMRDARIRLCHAEEEEVDIESLGNDAIVMIPAGSEYHDALMQQYDQSYLFGHIWVYYN